MNILTVILLVTACIIAIVLILAALKGNEFKLEREITVNKPKQEVFNYLKYLRNQDNFSKWASIDPNMKKEFKGTDGTVGFMSAWDSDVKNVGKGEQTITKIVEGERIETDLHFIKPWENRARAFMTLESVSGNQTKVKWGFSSPMKFPMKIMHVFMNMDKMVGNDFDTGLKNLKGLLEK